MTDMSLPLYVIQDKSIYRYRVKGHVYVQTFTYLHL